MTASAVADGIFPRIFGNWSSCAIDNLEAMSTSRAVAHTEIPSAVVTAFANSLEGRNFGLSCMSAHVTPFF